MYWYLFRRSFQVRSLHLQVPIPRAQRGKKTEALLLINHAVSLSKRCREAKPSNVVELSWAIVPFSRPNSHFPCLQKWKIRCGTLIAPDGMFIQGNISFLLLLVCLLYTNCRWYMKYHPDISDRQVIPCVRDTGKDTHKCQHHITKSEVSTAKQRQAPAKNLLKPTKLKSHRRAIKTTLRPDDREPTYTGWARVTLSFH